MPDSTAILVMLVAVTIKTAALVAVGLLAARALGRVSAACRHLLWTAVLAGVLIIALTAPLPPSWSLPSGASMVMPRIARTTLVPQVPITTGASSATLRRTPDLQNNTNAHGRRLGVTDALVLFWLGGIGVLVLRLSVGRMALRRVAARGRPLSSGPAATGFRALKAETRVYRRVRLIETDALTMPATWGIFRPVIAMPVAATNWSHPRVEAVLRHELAHVQRHDALTQLCADVCCAWLWFHPAVWLAARRMRTEREHACDDAVLFAGAASLGYADLLLSLAAGEPPGTRTAIAMADARDLEARLRAILDPAVSRSSPRALMVSVPTLALMATVTVAGLDLWRAAPLQASVASAAQNAAIAAPDSLEFLFGERLPFTVDDERRAMERQFQPRDADEAQAYVRLHAAARHQKQHPLDLVRDRALWALAIAAEDQVVAPVTARLADADWRVRAYAAWTLGLIGPARAREELTQALRDPVWRVRSAVASTLAALADPRTTDDMLTLLTDPSWQVRAAAVEFLGHIETPATRAAVRSRLNDPHVAVRSAAETALAGSPTR